jgi:hypothetical protein
MPKFRTKQQNSRMFGLASKCGLSHDDLRDYAAEVSNGRTDHTSELYTNEAQTIIKRLESIVNPKPVSRRTVNYRRQQAGIQQIATQKHLKLMNDLAAKRKLSEEGLSDLSARVNDGNREPRTTKEVNRVVEALKDMIRRDRVFGAFPKKEAA